MNRHHCWSALFIIAVLFAGVPFPAQAEDPLEILQDHDVTTNVGEGKGTSLNVGDSSGAAPASSGTPSVKAYSIAVLSDLHIKAENQKAVDRAIRAVNGLAGISAVALTGDLNEKVSSPQEFSRVVSSVSAFRVPVFAVTGNHDYIYNDHIDSQGNKSRGTPATRKAKLERFRKQLKQKGTRYFVKAGGHLLVFLSLDALKGKPLAGFSDDTMDFLRKTLKDNPKLPTIIFCHAPLAGSYERKTDLGPTHANIQPADKVASLLKDNPQVFLWVAGHLHIRPSSKDFTSKENKVGGVTVVHAPNITSSEAWIRLIRLTPEAAVVRTYSTKTGTFLPRHDRTFRHKNGIIEEPADPTIPDSSPDPADDQTIGDPEDSNDPEVSVDVNRPDTTGKPPSTQQPDRKHDIPAGFQSLLERIEKLIQKVKDLAARVSRLMKN